MKKQKGNKPYPIPVGGSNGIGTWGYIDGVSELLKQWESYSTTDDIGPSLDHIVFACGSGGTAAGIALGIALAHGALQSKNTSDMYNSSRKPKVHAIGVCDNPDYFYNHVAGIAEEMGLTLPPGTTTEGFIRKHMVVYQGKGKGYARSTPEELDFVKNFAQATGVVLDPVYSGKALYNFLQVVDKEPEMFRDQNILFWHTGGSIGLFDKCDDLLPTIKVDSPCLRLDVYGKGIGLDVSEEV